MPEGKEASSHPWRRHDLLRVAPDAYASALAHCPSAVDLPLLRTWADRGWPVIIRRRAEYDDPRLAPVGVPLPPAAGKGRVALLLPPAGVLQRSSPPSLRAAANVANSGWRSTIASLLDLGERIGVEPSAFGSLMWQHETGLTYLSPRSDLDLLWSVPTGFDVFSLVSDIAEIQTRQCASTAKSSFPKAAQCIGRSCGTRIWRGVGLECWLKQWRAFGSSISGLCRAWGAAHDPGARARSTVCPPSAAAAKRRRRAADRRPGGSGAVARA
jgi:phosphoribosyl-dephospho-CoA transferase